MSRSELKVGVFAGLILIGWAMLGIRLGWENNAMGDFSEYVVILVLAGAAYAVVREKREVEGTVTFGKAFYSGIITCFLAILLLGGFYYINTKYIDPHYTDRMVEQQRQYMIERKEPANRMAERLELVRSGYSPNGQFVIIVGISTLYALFASLVVAAFMSRRKKDVAQE